MACELDTAADDGRRGVPLRTADWGIALAAALVALAAYVPLLAPGLLRADMGEFQTLAVTLGYAHPTGYPVYLLAAKAATAIPVGEWPRDAAYRVNLLSALIAAAAVGLMWLLGRVLTGRRWVPLAGAAALAFSPTFWSQALMAGFYTSIAACMLGVLLLLRLWQIGGKARWLFAAACLGGVSLGIHTTVAFMAPAAILFVLLHPQRRWANLGVAVLGAIAGAGITLAAYAVIDRADSPCSYFRVAIDPSRSQWDLTADDTDGFLDRVKLSLTAPQFQGKLFSQPAKVTRQKTLDYFANLPSEFPPLWLAAALAGLLRLGRLNAKMSVLLAFTFAAHLAFNLQFDGIVYLKHISTYVLIAVFGTAGLAWASDALGAAVARFDKRKHSPGMLDATLAIAGLVVVAIPMILPGAWNAEGRRAYWVPPEERDEAGVAYSRKFHLDVRALIGKLEDDAVVFTGWNHVYPYYYVAHVEQGRTGIEILFDYPGEFARPEDAELADSALQYVEQIRRETPQRPIHFTHEVKKVKEVYELRRTHEGLEPLYRVGKLREEE